MKLSKVAPLYWLVGLLFITACLSLAVAFFVDPEFVARYLSPDGVLSSETVRDIQRLRIIPALMAIPVLLTLAVLLRGGHAAAQRVVRGGHAAAQRVVSRVRPLLLMERPDWLYRLILSVVLLICGGIYFAGLLESWESARGAEYWGIARSIAEGHGFSANELNRWFWYDFARDASEYATDEYYPTAISEPLYPLLLGTSYRWFGESGAFAVLLLQLLAWLATCALVYAVGRRTLGRTAGLLAGVSLALWPSTKFLALGYLGPAPFGGLLVVAIAYQTIRTRSHGKLRHDVLLGVLLGVATLTLASSQVFIPLSAASVVFLRGWNQRRSWLSAFAIIVCAAAVIAPWTVRNWQVFGEFVPVRTGVGLISHQGNPVLSATFHPNPQACTNTLGPIWSATGPGDAIRQARSDQVKETEIYKRSFDCIAERAPENFVQFNEAQRDKFYLAQTIREVSAIDICGVGCTQISRSRYRLANGAHTRRPTRHIGSATGIETTGGICAHAHGRSLHRTIYFGVALGLPLPISDRAPATVTDDAFRGVRCALCIEPDPQLSIFTDPSAPGCDPGLNVMILSGLQIMK